MKIALVEDDLRDGQIIAQHVRRFCFEKQVYAHLQTFVDGEQFLGSGPERYDVVLLDIYLQTITGVEIARQLRSMGGRRTVIIFVTVSRQFALDGFEVNALHYLVKPVSYQAVREAMTRAVAAVDRASFYITVPCGREMRRILLNHIFFIDCYSHAIQIHTARELIRSYIPFSQAEALVAPYENFIWCYRNLIINLDFVQRMEKRAVHLTDGTVLPINKEKQGAIRRQYMDYCFKRCGNGDI